jgi:hypothetical protein
MATLIDRVSCAIDGRINPDQWLHREASRAAISEVARWLDAEAHQRGLQPHNGIYDAADWLRGELEAEQ